MRLSSLHQATNNIIYRLQLLGCIVTSQPPPLPGYVLSDYSYHDLPISRTVEFCIWMNPVVLKPFNLMLGATTRKKTISLQNNATTKIDSHN